MAVGGTNYPGAIDTATELVRAVNRASSTLTAAIASGDTSITVVDASKAPSDGVIWIDNEAIAFTGKSGNTFTGCSRGFDGTAAASHSLGAVVYFDIIPAIAHTATSNAIIAVESKVGSGASTPVADRFLRGSGTGTSNWALLALSDIITGLGISPAADRLLYFTGAATVALHNFTAFGRSLVAAVDAAAVKTLLALVKGDVGLGNVDNTSDATKNSASATLQNKTLDNTNSATLRDTNLTLQDDADTTKQAKLDVNAEQTTGTTTNHILPSTSQTLVGRTSTDTMTNKTLTAPTITDFSNMAHDHLDADDGGNLSADAITSGQFTIARLASGTPNGTKFIRDDGTLAVPPGGPKVFCATSPETATGSTTVIDFATQRYTIPANDAVVGKVYRITARGLTTNPNASARTINFHVRLGGVAIASSGAANIGASVTNLPWQLTFDLVVITTGVSGTAEAQGERRLNATLLPLDNTATVAFDTTVAKTFGLAVTHELAGQSTVQRELLVEAL